MIWFYAIAAALAVGTLVLVLAPLVLRARPAEARDAKDARLFRQQLAEVERDLERGVIGAAEAEGARAEISRRLIAATARAKAAKAPRAAPRRATGLVAGLAVIGLPLVALAAYLWGGMPGAPDQPFAARGLEPSIRTAGAAPPRPGQAEMEAATPAPGTLPTAEAAEFAQLIERLEDVVAVRGDDVQGLTLLANGYMRLGRPAEAWPVFALLVRLKGEAVPADLLASQAEAMVMAAGGYVSPEAEQVIARTLAADPLHVVARYYKGMAEAQQGRIGQALATWQALRADLSEDDPMARALEGMIGEATALQQQAPALPGPTEGQVEAAAAMSAEERQQMIAGMVQRLEDRLTTEGGGAEEWLRLMTSYNQLGRREDARRAYEMGREALGSEGGAGFLREQALVLGIVEE